MVVVTLSGMYEWVALQLSATFVKQHIEYVYRTVSHSKQEEVGTCFHTPNNTSMLEIHKAYNNAFVK